MWLDGMNGKWRASQANFAAKDAGTSIAAEVMNAVETGGVLFPDQP